MDTKVENGVERERRRDVPSSSTRPVRHEMFIYKYIGERVCVCVCVCVNPLLETVLRDDVGDVGAHSPRMCH
jgi:hypothetical protein